MEFPTGFPRYFNIDTYLDAVESMICADEIKFALTMLDNMPGYYRDYIPDRARQIRAKIYEQCMTVQDYINDRDESIEKSEKDHKCKLKDMWKAPHFTPRGSIIMDIVKKENDKGNCVNIVELGPYNYWLPVGLDSEGCDFIYTPMSVNSTIKCPIETKTSSDKPIKNIFVCFEVIEHLWNEDEIVHYFYKTQMEPDYVLISTPKYTCGHGLFNWQYRTLGHIRTWTPQELTTYCKKHWPELNWFFYDHAMMVSIGCKESL